MKPRSNTVGVIGCGQIASEVHLPVLRAMGFNVCWILDPNVKSVRAVSRVFGAESLMSAADLSTAEAPEVVVLACPYGVRSDYYRAFETHMRNSAILVEKPIALTTAEHDLIVGLREDHKVGGGYNRRRSPQLQFVKSILDSGMLGMLQAADFQYGFVGNKTAGKYAANLKLAGGGPLFDTGVHGIDSILFTLGARDAHVQDVFMKMDAGFDVHTSAQLAIETDGGTVPCRIKVTLLANTTNSIRLDFERCRLEFSLFREGVYLTPNTGAPEVKVAISNSGNVPIGSHVKECIFWTDFLDAVRSGTCNYTNLVNSRLTTSVVEAIYSQGGSDKP